MCRPSRVPETPRAVRSRDEVPARAQGAAGGRRRPAAVGRGVRPAPWPVPASTSMAVTDVDLWCNTGQDVPPVASRSVALESPVPRSDRRPDPRSPVPGGAVRCRPRPRRGLRPDRRGGHAATARRSWCAATGAGSRRSCADEVDGLVTEPDGAVHRRRRRTHRLGPGPPGAAHGRGAVHGGPCHLGSGRRPAPSRPRRGLLS